MRERGIIKVTSILMIITIIYRILGFFREMVIASNLGASMQADVYYVAFTIPRVLYDVLAFGAISAAIIPIASKYIIKEEYEQLNKLTNSIYNMMFVITTCITVLSFLGAEYLVGLIAPGFNEYATVLAVKLTKLMLPTIIFLGFSAVTQSILNVRKHFIIPAASNIFYNFIILICAYIFLDKYGVFALAYAIVIATVIQFVIQLTMLVRFDYRYQLIMEYRSEDIKMIFRLMFPIFLGAVIMQANVVIDKSIASTLHSGSIAALSYAYKLIQLPLGVIIGAIVTTTFPQIAQYVETENYEDLRKIVIKSFRVIILLLIPIMIILIFLSKPIINILFERDAFTEYDTFLTSRVLSLYALGLLGLSFTNILTKIFQAFKNTIIPVAIGSIAMLLNLVLNIILSKYMQSNGIALATSISATLNCSLLYYFLNKRYKFIKLSINLWFILKMLISTLTVASLAFITSNIFVNIFINFNITLRLVIFLIMIILVLTVYYFLLKLFKIEEVIKFKKVGG